MIDLAIFGTFAIAVVATTALAVLATWRATRPVETRAPVRCEGITVLKPLCGADEDLADNLETMFLQRGVDFEIVFGVEGDGDPAISVARALMARYPEIPARLVVHDGHRALNPKVSNLRAMLDHATHDVVVVSDSNVAVGPDYLRTALGELQRPEGRPVGLVTHLVTGQGERTWGSVLEALQWNHVAGSVSSSSWWGSTFCVGKSMMLRRSQLEALGGFEAVATTLAEDYVIGRMYQAAGYAVRLAPGVVHNVSRDVSVSAFWRRQRRWALMRSRLQPLLYPAELALHPLAAALVAPWIGLPWRPAWAMAIALILLRDAALWLRLRGTEGLARALVASVPKELLLLSVWALAPLSRRVGWRGRRYRISAGTRLYAERPTHEDPHVAPAR